MGSIPLPSTSGIYQITCIPTGKFYIGSSTDIRKRWHQHQSALLRDRHHSRLLQRAWAAHGPDAFAVTVLELCPPDTLIAREQHYLDTLRPYDRGVGFNTARDAAVSSRGLTISPDHRERISRALRGRVIGIATREKLAELRRGKSVAHLFTAEVIAKNAAARRGRVQPPHTRELIAASKRGKPRSAETRAKISRANAGQVVSEETRAKRRAYVPTPQTRALLSRLQKGRPKSMSTRQKLSESARKLQSHLVMHTPEARAKAAETRRGIPRSAEVREKIAAAKRGHRHSPETLAKMRGRKRSEESRQRMRDAARKRRERKL